MNQQGLFSWSDRHGNKHWLTTLGNSLCNHKRPMWLKDVGLIGNKSNLPITGLSYTMHDEGQKAKIKLGPLTCLPKEKEDSFDLKVLTLFFVP